MSHTLDQKISGGVHQDQRHDSAHKHVSGEAEYIDDIVSPIGTLHAYLGLSDIANGTIKSTDFTDVLSVDGVIGVLTGKDIKGHNDISPTGKHDDPVFAENVEFYGQPLSQQPEPLHELLQKKLRLIISKTPM
jgi:xanthine dehydrogenase large subunit